MNNGQVLVTNFSIEMERKAREENRYIHIVCNKIVANKVDKFFKIAMKHNVNVLDVYIHEWPHVPWLPETQGTFGGFINVIVEKPSDDFLLEIHKKLPMTSSTATTETSLTNVGF